ncbi:NUDIX domain-containing protein [Patescibacteria group bacterium]|nr:NUDIX domain-containing protein [Patescibacteria group bacterium]
MFNFPTIAVGALILNPKSELFLMSAHSWKSRYVVPGGHVEYMEELEKALKREVWEETNLEIFDIDFFGYYESINNTEFFKKKHFIFMDFLCHTKSEKVVLNEEGLNYVWVSPENALKLDLAGTTRQLIEDFIQSTHA